MVGHARGQAWAPESEWQGEIARLKAGGERVKAKVVRCVLCLLGGPSLVLDSHGRERWWDGGSVHGGQAECPDGWPHSRIY